MSTARGGRSGGVRRLQVEVVAGRTTLRTPGLAAWLEAVAPASARGMVTIALAGDARVRALNRQFLGKDRATDVLSFPAGTDAPFAGEAGPRPLGELIIAAGVARRQAAAARHGVQTEVRVLALHGLLHLLGYDHETDGGEMARLEARLRRKAGLREGLIERGHRA